MEALKKNLKQIVQRMKRDWDYCLAITGKKRRGKSTLGYHISEYVSSKLGSNVHLCYDYHGENGLREALFNAEKHDVIFADESISFLESGSWNTPEAKEFIELFDRFGDKNLFYILIMPSFSSFVKKFREHRLDARIWLPKRGRMWVYPVQDGPNGIYMAKKPMIKEDFPPLPEEKEKEYREIKHQRNMETIKRKKEQNNATSTTMREYLIWINAQLLKGCPRCNHQFTQKERSKILGRSTKTLREYDKIIKTEGEPEHPMKAYKEAQKPMPIPS